MKGNVITTLEKANYNSNYYVKEFSPYTKLNINKLYNIGITKNAEITPLFGSVISGVRAYLVKGSVIALRNHDAKDIIVNLHE